jgi:hypothetical protein
MPKQPSPEELGQFMSEIIKNPDLLLQMKRRAELDKFKETYHVTKASGLKCPACSAYLSFGGGSLWWDPTQAPSEDGTCNSYYEFACRKCNLTWSIACTSKPLEEVQAEIKEINNPKAKSKNTEGVIEIED